MLIRFTKMHGAGNDYIYINGIESCPPELGKLSRLMSDRHKGIGADGVVVIMKSDVADFRMRMFNADGSEGKMCGNASRCIAKYVYDKGLTKKHVLTLETLSGIKPINIKIVNNEVNEITVDMGCPILEPEKIPVSDGKLLIKTPVETKDGVYDLTAISMGNPHAVTFVDNLNNVNVEKVGRELENHSLFPERANIEFAEILNQSEIRMRVWERGSGETMACGTGACAVAVAGVMSGLCERKVNIHLLGGDLQIKWDEANDHVYMTGDATTVFEGEYEYNL